MLFYACFTQFLLDLYSIDPEYLHIVYNYIFIPSAIVRWLYHWLTLSLFLCLPWCWYIINISVMLRHSAGWFIAYFCVSACSLIVPLHLSLWLSLSYLMCLHTPGLSPSPCPSVPLCLVWLPGCCVYRSWLIIFVSVSTCPLLPDLLQHLPLASIEIGLSHLTCVSSILEWVCVFSCHPSLHLLHFLLSPRPICLSHFSISLCPLWCVLPPPLPACFVSFSCLPPVHPSPSFTLALIFSLFLTHSHHSFPPWPHFFSQFHHSVINPAGPSISEVWEILLTSFSILAYSYTIE